MCEPLLQRIRKPIERAMRDAQIGTSDLAEVVLVGGASRMPLIARLVTRMFGRLPLRHVNPDEAIARVLGGAATCEEACDSLLGMALEGGAPDNVTMIVTTNVTLSKGQGQGQGQGQ